MVLRELKFPDAAMDAAKHALAIDPDLPEAHNNLANALKDNGDLANAIQHYRSAVAMEPANRQYYENLVGALLEHEELDGAETISRLLLKHIPGSIAGFAGLGEVAARREQWQAAKAWLLKAVEGGSRDPRVFHNLGVVNQELRDFPRVPVVTLVGPAHRQRVSYSMLKNIGVEETIAWNEDEYVTKAVRLAGDPQALAELRRRIAGNIRRSILCDAPRFTRQFEAALLRVWAERRAAIDGAAH